MKVTVTINDYDQIYLGGYDGTRRENDELYALKKKVTIIDDYIIISDKTGNYFLLAHILIDEFILT